MAQLPVPRSTLDLYLAEVNRHPLLTREEEQELARRYVEEGDPEAAQTLVTANLRFVVKVAYEYRNYDVKLTDLIQEGNIGLMRAVSKFNPDRGYRLISYAVWWIKAYMQNYILRNWSMVRPGSGSRNRSLFFRGSPLGEGEAERLLPSASSMVVGEGAATPPPEMRMALRDFSLDASMDEDGKRTFLDALPDTEDAADVVLVRQEERHIVGERLEAILKGLNPKERHILKRRILADEPETLQQIGERFGISRERVRQIEQALKLKIRKDLVATEGFTYEE